MTDLELLKQIAKTGKIGDSDSTTSSTDALQILTEGTQAHHYELNSDKSKKDK